MKVGRTDKKKTARDSFFGRTVQGAEKVFFHRLTGKILSFDFSEKCNVSTSLSFVKRMAPNDPERSPKGVLNTSTPL